MTHRIAILAGIMTGVLSQTVTAQNPDNVFKGSVAALSDYRFRGLSQTFREPALQLSAEYAMRNGIYIGGFASNVSDTQYPGGNTELDLLGGYRFSVAEGADADIGIIYYAYPGANYDEFEPPVADEKFDTAEVYAGLTIQGFTTRLSYAITDYFGLNGDTAAAYGNDDSKGTVYAGIDYSHPLTETLSLLAHAGHSWIAGYSNLNYSDFKIAVGATVADVTFELAGVTTAGLSNAGEAFNTYSDGTKTEQVYDSTVTFAVSYVF